MIEERDGDIFKQQDLDVIAHQANCFCTFGAGIAAVIANLFPEAAAADKQTKHGDKTKMGTFSSAVITRGDRKFIIANVYSQYGASTQSRQTEYDHLVNGLEKVRDAMKVSSGDLPAKIGLPYGLGSDLAGGNWKIVKAIVESVFENEPNITCVICRLPGSKELS